MSRRTKRPSYFEVRLYKDGWGVFSKRYGMTYAPDRVHWMHEGVILEMKSEHIARKVCALMNKEVSDDVDYCRLIRLP